MTNGTDNLVLEHLGAIRATVEALREYNREIKTRFGILEQQYASLSSRIDRIEIRLDRIERRLGLIEA
jgi:predicted  nucleic acid-binding Zn-ribbon protein